MSEFKLPPLPEPDKRVGEDGPLYGVKPGDYYTAETVERLRLEAVEAYKQQQQGEAVEVTDEMAYAYAVYFPDEAREELVHRLDDLLDDLTNCTHGVTPLYAHPAPAQQRKTP